MNKISSLSCPDAMDQQWDFDLEKLADWKMLQNYTLETEVLPNSDSHPPAIEISTDDS